MEDEEVDEDDEEDEEDVDNIDDGIDSVPLLAVLLLLLLVGEGLICMSSPSTKSDITVDIKRVTSKFSSIDKLTDALARM